MDRNDHEKVCYGFIFEGQIGDQLNRKVEEYATGLGLKVLYARQSTEFLKIVVVPRKDE